MSRPLSWYPLASSDPVPGDPSTVRTAGEDYQDVARAINAAADALTQIADVEGNVSYAINEIREKATEVAEDIRKAHQRYDGVGGALVTYASALDSAQVESAGALADAKAAQSAIDSANATIASTSTAASHVNDPAAQASFARTISRARQERDDAEARLAAARTRLDDAVASRDAAARTAVDAIENTTAHDGLRDNLWENLNLGAICNVISDIAGVIASVAGILSLVLCWVPVLGQALAAVALIASAVKLVADLALAIWDDGSWADVAWGVFAVASFGVGRVLSFGAQGVTRGAAGIARRAAGQVGAMSRASRAAAGLPTGSARTTIQALVGSTTGALSRNAARGLASQGRLSTWLGNGLNALKPSAIVGDIAKMGQFSWSSAMAQVRSNFALAGSNPAAIFAATQADGVLVQAIHTAGEVSPSLAQFSPQVSQALTGAVATQVGSFSMVGLGAADTSLGMQQMTDTVFTGKPFELPIVENVSSVIDWFDPSPAEQLKLVDR